MELGYSKREENLGQTKKERRKKRKKEETKEGIRRGKHMRESPMTKRSRSDNLT
jgi:hypothetical protein